MSSLLTEEDIILFHSSIFRLPLKKDFFAKPSGETLSQVLQLFLTEFGIDNLYTADINAVNNIANLERYDDWIPKSNLCNVMAAIMGSRNIDFGMKDMMNPTRKKLQRVLSVLIHIWYKFNAAKESWTEIERKSASKAQDKARIVDAISELKRSVEEKSLFLSQNRSKFQNCETELNKLLESFDDKKLHGQNLEERSREVKQTCAEQKEKISELAIAVGEYKEEIFQLKQRIVRSPDKILAETQSKEKELETKRMEKRKNEKEYMEIVKNVDMIRDATKDMKPSMESLQETFRDIEAVREKCTSIDELKEKLKAKQNKLQQLQVVKQQAEANFVSLKEQINRSRFQHQQRIKPLSKMNDDIKKQIEEKKASLSVNKQQEKLLDEEQKYIKDIVLVKQDRQNFSEKLQTCYKRAETSASILKSALEQNI
ncbi:Kinetochore protein Nuf2 [Halotydeus destructor]|nr:Kinetochore protein Nuf2 [Halotydeus destructor]